MPGARLSRSERELIARGLRERLDHAEIARRLQRPTSTVTREVRRNRGASGYDPAEAHESARARAVRTRAPSAAAGAAGDPAMARVNDELLELVASSGVPRTAARVLVSVYLAEDGLGSAELVERLGVSRAAVSNAVTYLDALGLLRRDRVPGSRRERYRVGDEVWQTAWRVSTRVNEQWADVASRAVELLGSDSQAGARLRSAARFFRGMIVMQSMGPMPVVSARTARILRELALRGAPFTADQLLAALTPDQRAALEEAARPR